MSACSLCALPLCHRHSMTSYTMSHVKYTQTSGPLSPGGWVGRRLPRAWPGAACSDLRGRPPRGGGRNTQFKTNQTCVTLPGGGRSGRAAKRSVSERAMGPTFVRRERPRDGEHPHMIHTQYNITPCILYYYNVYIYIYIYVCMYNPSLSLSLSIYIYIYIYICIHT